MRYGVIFTSYDDRKAVSPIDKGVSWRITQTISNVFRELGCAHTFILYNDGISPEETPYLLKPATIDNLAALFPFHHQDEVFFALTAHGTLDGCLSFFHGEKIAPQTISDILCGDATTCCYYGGCYAGLFFTSVPPNVVFVLGNDKHHVSWIDKNYSSACNFFSAFLQKQTSLEEAIVAVKEKWDQYSEQFLFPFIRLFYRWPRDIRMATLGCNPVVRRGKNIPVAWTIKKR